MCDVLDVPGESRIIVAALDAIENILTVGERHNLDYCTTVDECGGIDKLEKLQEHADDAIYNKAAFVDDDSVLSYGQLSERVRRMACGKAASRGS